MKEKQFKTLAIALIKYSFIINGKFISYQFLTNKEKKLISEKEYELLINYIEENERI